MLDFDWLIKQITHSDNTLFNKKHCYFFAYIPEMYVIQIEKGCIDVKESPIILKENIATAFVDGRCALGKIRKYSHIICRRPLCFG